MSWTIKNTLLCDKCGLFCSPKTADEYTIYGCSSYDPPEPHDPAHICKRCWGKVKKEWINGFKKGYRDGDWQKSRAEQEAAKECGLKWVGSGGVGMLGTKDFADSHQYIDKKEFDRLNKLPYYGYCKKCGAERKGGYCSDKKCSKSFERSTR